MRPRILIALILALCTLLTSAFAYTDMDLVDAEFLTPYFPEYTLLHGVDEGDTLYLLMQKPSGETVFIGGVQSADGAWTFTESTPLPEGAFLGVENFSTSLGIPIGGKNLCVTLTHHADGTWGVYDLDFGAIRVGSTWVSDTQPLRGVIGDHPWGDITSIDWTTLPRTCEEAIAHVDFSRWGVVESDDTPLLAEPSSKSVLGKYSTGAPVCVREFRGDYARVAIGNVEGWMRLDCLALNVEISTVPSMEIYWLSEGTYLYAAPDETAAVEQLPDSISTGYILGTVGEDWAHIWLPTTDAFGYIKVESIFYGDG